MVILERFADMRSFVYTTVLRYKYVLYTWYVISVRCGGAFLLGRGESVAVAQSAWGVTEEESDA